MPRVASKKNFAHTLISNSGVAIGPTATSIPVVSTADFPDPSGGYFTIRIPSTGECIEVRGVSGNIFTPVVRGLPEGAAGTYSGTTILDGSECDEIFGAADIAHAEDYLPPIDGSNITSGTISSARLPANVSSIKKTGSSALTGDVTLTGGTGVTLTQSGQDISIAASAGGGSGTVTSVGLSLPADFTVSGSPVTGSGTLTAVRNTQSANAVFAGPTTGSPASPAYRLLVAGDLPSATTSAQGAVTLANVTPTADGTGAIGSSTAAARADHVHPLVTSFTAEVTVPDLKVSGLTGSVQAMRVVGATSSGAPVTGAHLVGDASLSLADGKWYVCTVAGTPGTFVSAAGSGTVTSVGLSVPSALLNVSGSPITGSGTLALSLATQSANTVLAGPTTGSAATPTMRALVPADLASGVAGGFAQLDGDLIVPSFELPPPPSASIAEAGRWVRSGSNPILSATATWEGTGVGEPTVLYDGVFKMWYTGSWTSVATGYATSPDGITWTKYVSNPVVGQGGSSIAGVACRNSVVKVNGVYYMYYSDGIGTTPNLQVATSTDGIAWTYRQVAIANNAVVGFTGWVNSTVWVEGTNSWKMLVEGSNGTIWKICYATSTDGLTWTVISTTLTGLQAITGGMYGGPCVPTPQKYQGLYHLWYHAASSAGNLPTDLYHATSADLIAWTRVGPILTHLGTGFEIDQVADPSVVEVNGQSYIFYDGDDNTLSHSSIGVAIFPGTLAQIVQGAPLIKDAANGVPVLNSSGKVATADLPLATASTVGAAKFGSGLAIDGAGNVTATGSSTTHYEPLTNGSTASPDLIYYKGDVVMVPVAN